MHSLSPERLTQLLASSEAKSLSVEASRRLSLIAEYVAGEHSISEICARVGIARSTLHRWLDRFDPANLSALEEKSHVPNTARASGVEQESADLIRQYREKFTLIGKEKIHELLLQEHNIDLSSSTIGRIIERDGLYFAATPLHWKKRMGYQTKEPRSKLQDPHNSQFFPTESEQPKIHGLTFCSCFWCTFWKTHGRSVLRTFGMSSLLINIAFLALYSATVMWEHDTTQSLSANITQHQTGTVSNLDAPPFDER